MRRARDQCAARLPVLEPMLGSERPETLTIRINLASWTEEAGGTGREAPNDPES